MTGRASGARVPPWRRVRRPERLVPVDPDNELEVGEADVVLGEPEATSDKTQS